MRTTLDLDATVLETARALARQRRVGIGVIVSELVRKGLADSRGQTNTSRTLPVFSVPEDAPPLNPERIRELIQDEGTSF